MITEAEVQASMDYLFESAEKAAQARADRAVLTEGLKRIKALEMQKALYAKSLGEKEMAAYASDAYRVALEGMGVAVAADEGFRAMRDAHAARIEAWRTWQATMRSVRL